MNIHILKNKITQLGLAFFLYPVVSSSFAELPARATYSTSTSHNCIGYECKRSLYPQETLDIERKNISQTQYEAIIEKHINNIQTTQTNFPGFVSTVKRKIPENLANNALHCHEAKAKKSIWDNASQRTTTLEYRHECWQLERSQKNSSSHVHQEIKRINDIIYTVKITRTATACSSAQYFLNPDKFECVANPEPEKIVSNFRDYSFLPLDDVIVNNFITIQLGDEELNFTLVDISEDLFFDVVSTVPNIDSQPVPADTSTNPIPIVEPPRADDPDPELGGTDEPGHDGEEPELAGNDEPSLDNDDEPEHEEESDHDNSPHFNDEHENEEHGDDSNEHD